MPQAIAFVKSVVQFVVLFAGGSSAGAWAATFLIGAVKIQAAGFVLGKLYQIPEIGLAQQGASMLANSSSSTAPIPVIYGARRVGGRRQFILKYNIGSL